MDILSGPGAYAKPGPYHGGGESFGLQHQTTNGTTGAKLGRGLSVSAGVGHPGDYDYPCISGADAHFGFQAAAQTCRNNSFTYIGRPDRTGTLPHRPFFPAIITQRRNVRCIGGTVYSGRSAADLRAVFLQGDYSGTMSPAKTIFRACRA